MVCSNMDNHLCCGNGKYLYKAIEKDNVKQAIIISAVTFGADRAILELWSNCFYYTCSGSIRIILTQSK